MKKVIRFVAQCINAENGDLIEESILKEETLTKAKTLKELGYLHIEQIDFLQKIQDFKTKHQIILNAVNICPKCASKTKKGSTAFLVDNWRTLQKCIIWGIKVNSWSF